MLNYLRSLFSRNHKNGSILVESSWLELSWMEEKNIIAINMIVSDGIRNVTEYSAYIGRDKPVLDLVASYVFRHHLKHPVIIYIGYYSKPLFTFYYTSKTVEIFWGDKHVTHIRGDSYNVSTELDSQFWDRLVDMTK